MANGKVEDILRQIDSLDAEDREALEDKLAGQLERQWLAEAEKIRLLAKQRGITQDEIDQAIREIRRRA